MKRVSGQKPKRPQAQKGTTPMDEALKFLGPRARTVREVERHLDDAQYGEYEVQQVVERLEELNLLNDTAYAEEFVRSRLATKPLSRRRLYEQLSAHELPRDVIEAALANVPEDTEQQNANAIARKFARQFEQRGLTTPERDEQLLKRLVSRGYSYDMAREAIAALNEEQE